MEPYPSGQFGFIDDPDCQFGNGSVWTRTRTRSDGPELLLTLVVRTQAGYFFVHERRKWMAEVTRDDDQQAHMQKEVLEDWMSESQQETRTIRKPVPFSTQPAKADHVENNTSKTPKGAKVPRKKAPDLDTGNYEVLGSS